MANKDNMPQCSHCFGQNWIDLGVIRPGGCGEMIDYHTAELLPDVHLYQCGHGAAFAEEMKNGCSRIICATPEEMNKGGTI